MTTEETVVLEVIDRQESSVKSMVSDSISVDDFRYAIYVPCASFALGRLGALVCSSEPGGRGWADLFASAPTLKAQNEGLVIQAEKLLADGITLLAQNEKLLESIKKHIENCGSCGGTGEAHTLEHEEDFGMPPGSSKIPCPECSDIRAAIAEQERGEG